MVDSAADHNDERWDADGRIVRCDQESNKIGGSGVRKGVKKGVRKGVRKGAEAG